MARANHGRSFAFTAFSSGFGILATLASGILLARLLSVEDRGIVALLIYWVSFAASIGSLSLHEAFILRASQSDRPVEERLPSTIAVSALLLIATFCVTGFVLSFMSDRLGGLDIRLALAFLGLYLLIRSTDLTLVAVEQSSLQFNRLALEQALLPLCYSGMLFVAAFADSLTVFTVLAIFLISRTPLLAVRILRYGKMIIGPLRRDEASAVTRIGARFHSTALVRNLADQADKIVISLQWTVTSVANFAVAFSAAGAAYALVGRALGVISLPVASKVPKEEMADHFTLAIRITSILLVAIMIPIIVLAPYFVPLVFGAQYEGAVLYTQVLALTLLPVPVTGLVDAMLRGRGHTGSAMRLHVTTLILFAIGWVVTGYAEIVSLGLGLAGSRLGALIYTFATLRDELNSVRLLDCIAWRREDFRMIFETARGLAPGRAKGDS